MGLPGLRDVEVCNTMTATGLRGGSTPSRTKTSDSTLTFAIMSGVGASGL